MFPLYDLNPHRRFPWVTVLIIVVNVAVLRLQGIAAERANGLPLRLHSQARHRVATRASRSSFAPS